MRYNMVIEMVTWFFERIGRNEIPHYYRRRRCYRHRVRLAVACRCCCISNAYRRAVVLSRRPCGLPCSGLRMRACVYCVGHCVGALIGRERRWLIAVASFLLVSSFLRLIRNTKNRVERRGLFLIVYLRKYQESSLSSNNI